MTTAKSELHYLMCIDENCERSVCMSRREFVHKEADYMRRVAQLEKALDGAHPICPERKALQLVIAVEAAYKREGCLRYKDALAIITEII